MLCVPWCLLSLGLVSCLPGAPEGASVSATLADSLPHSAYVTANGIRLHYLDWGGEGETVLFLHGLGDEAIRFHPLAMDLRRDFRVLGLDWRGHGQSDAPDTGYDTGTLVSDLKAFLDAVGIGKVSLVGHSLAGDQITRFAALYPDRVRELVYLDAAFDRSDLPELLAGHPSPPPAPTDPIVRRLQRGSEASHPDYSKVFAPALAYFVIPDPDAELPGSDDPEMRRRLREYVVSRMRPYVTRNVQRFRRDMVRACAVELRGTNHYFFLDQPGRFSAEIRSFLLDPESCEDGTLRARERPSDIPVRDGARHRDVARQPSPSR